MTGNEFPGTNLAKLWKRNRKATAKSADNMQPVEKAGTLPAADTEAKPAFVPNYSLHPNEFKRAPSHGLGSREPGVQTGSPFAGDLIRLGAALFTAGLFGLMIFNPLAGPKAVKTLAANNPLAGASLSEKACRAGDHIVTSDFTDFENVLSISPLGGVTAPGEILPAPYIRINTKNDGSPFQRRSTAVRAPANTDIVAIERRVVREQGESPRYSWTVHFKPCADVTIVYDRVDELNPDLIERAGGLSSFNEIGTADHLAREVALRVGSGVVIGKTRGFDVALHDAAVEYQELARPERYHRNTIARAELFNVSPSLIAAITPDHAKAQCALDYLRPEDREAWSDKLGDAWGIRRARGENACRTALIDLKGTAQGAWYTDAAHNGATTKISAVALAPDNIDPDRLIFALHGRLTSLSSDLIGRGSFNAAQGADRKITKDFITFEKGSGRINRAFHEIRDNEIYCYHNLRVNFVGPRVNGVILLQKTAVADNPADATSDLLKIEARGDLQSCNDMSADVILSEKATSFFR